MQCKHISFLHYWKQASDPNISSIQTLMAQDKVIGDFTLTVTAHTLRRIGWMEPTSPHLPETVCDLPPPPPTHSPTHFDLSLRNRLCHPHLLIFGCLELYIFETIRYPQECAQNSDVTLVSHFLIFGWPPELCYLASCVCVFNFFSSFLWPVQPDKMSLIKMSCTLCCSYDIVSLTDCQWLLYCQLSTHAAILLWLQLDKILLITR